MSVCLLGVVGSIVTGCSLNGLGQEAEICTAYRARMDNETGQYMGSVG